MTAMKIVGELKSLGSDSIKKVLMKHGAREPFFGVKVEHLKKIQKRIKVDHKLALELGFDAGFGPGTRPSDVANFVVHQVLQRIGKEQRGQHWEGEPK